MVEQVRTPSAETVEFGFALKDYAANSADLALPREDWNYVDKKRPDNFEFTLSEQNQPRRNDWTLRTKSSGTPKSKRPAPVISSAR